MFNMIKSDLYRMTKSKSFYLYWILLVVTYAISVVMKAAGGVQVGMGVDPTLKLDLQMVAMNFTYYFLFLFPVYGIVVSDFGEKTIKNTISSAISRRTYIISKFILTEVYTIGSFVLGNVMYYVVNSLVNGKKYTSEFSTFMAAVLRQCPIMIAVVALLVAIGFLLKRMASFNAITILVPMIYTSVAVSVYQAGAEKFAEDYMLKYELSTMLNKIVANVNADYFRNCILASIVILVISVVIGYNSFKKAEIK